MKIASIQLKEEESRIPIRDDGLVMVPCMPTFTLNVEFTDLTDEEVSILFNKFNAMLNK